MKLLIRPKLPPAPDEREHNRALLERYMPELMPFFIEAHKELGATMGTIEIDVPESDREFVMSMMDSTKQLVE